MFAVSCGVTSALWRLTGLGNTDTASAGGVWSSRLSVVYPAAVYASYACLCAAFAASRLSAHGRPAVADGKLSQIRLMHDMKMVLLFVASTATYWCAVAYRREHVDVCHQHAAVGHRLFGGRPPPCRALDACCWALYALLAVALFLDARRYAGDAHWTYPAVFAWGHYALLTGNMQFAVTVVALHRYYRELNGRMRLGGIVRRNAGDYDFGAGRRAGLQATVVDAKLLTPSAVLRNVMFVNVLDRVNLLTMLKYWSDIHWSITEIVSTVNNLFKFRLFVFFLCGLLHLMLTPYVLSLTILNENIDILPYIIERTLWFIIHIFRVILMIYPCALLGEEAFKTKILLGSYLNTKIDFFDIKKIETYAQQLDAHKPEFSIYSMFVIDRQLVVTLTGAVATYLVIILQLQDQS